MNDYTGQMTERPRPHSGPDPEPREFVFIVLHSQITKGHAELLSSLHHNWQEIKIPFQLFRLFNVLPRL